MFGIRRLTVVVRIEQQRALGAGRLPFGVNSRRRVCGWTFEQTRTQAALLHHVRDESGVLADVRGIGRDVRDREQREVLVEQLVLIRAAIVAHLVLGGLSLGQHRQDAKRQNNEQSEHWRIIVYRRTTFHIGAGSKNHSSRTTT